ncbi:uncharacterized protein [Palaemon carinicauda]|uniref:uncharacterized protein n=1 Tax=Palaemon carinicauda TaxID=392227 RepID=UPI0035B682A8
MDEARIKKVSTLDLVAWYEVLLRYLVQCSDMDEGGVYASLRRNYAVLQVPCVAMRDTWYKNFVWIEPGLFAEMVNQIFLMFIKKQTTMRDPLTVVLKLPVILHFMTSRDSYTSLQYSFRDSKSVICRFVPKVCKVIIDTNKLAVLNCPKTPKDWKTVSEVLVKKWNHHVWRGVLDRKHVPIKNPRKVGSLCYNYKKFPIITLMAVADEMFKFLYVD